MFTCNLMPRTLGGSRMTLVESSRRSTLVMIGSTCTNKGILTRNRSIAPSWRGCRRWRRRLKGRPRGSFRWKRRWRLFAGGRSASAARRSSQLGQGRASRRSWSMPKKRKEMALAQAIIRQRWLRRRFLYWSLARCYQEILSLYQSRSRRRVVVLFLPSSGLKTTSRWLLR